MAAKEAPFQQLIDVNHESFLNPENMIVAIQEHRRKTGQTVPETPGVIARCIYDNLALCYASELEKLEKMTGTNGKLSKLHIVGGGSNNKFLNQLTADVAQIEISAGPGEATAIGNILCRWLLQKNLSRLKLDVNVSWIPSHLASIYHKPVITRY